jgi:hypothetical protein
MGWNQWNAYVVMTVLQTITLSRYSPYQAVPASTGNLSVAAAAIAAEVLGPTAAQLLASGYAGRDQGLLQQAAVGGLCR